MSKALKSPKIAQIRWNRYFRDADTLPFPKLTDFLEIDKNLTRYDNLKNIAKLMKI